MNNTWKKLMETVSNFQGKSASYMTSAISEYGGGDMATGCKNALNFAFEEGKKAGSSKGLKIAIVIYAATVVGGSAYHAYQRYTVKREKHQDEGEKILNTLKKNMPQETDVSQNSTEELLDDAVSSVQDNQDNKEGT